MPVFPEAGSDACPGAVRQTVPGCCGPVVGQIWAGQRLMENGCPGSPVRGRSQGPFHRGVGGCVLQPARGGRFGCGPGRRFAGPRAEVQALAGSADELGPVTVRQAPGDERPRPGPAGGMPADLERAVAALPERNRRLIELMYMSGNEHSYEEIAVELGIPVASIGPTRIRSLKKLRKLLS